MRLRKKIALGLFAWITSTLIAVMFLQPALAIFVSTESSFSVTGALIFLAGMMRNAVGNLGDPVGFALVIWPIVAAIAVAQRINVNGVRWLLVVVDLVILFLVPATHNRWVGLATAIVACIVFVLAVKPADALTANT